ncbi:MAG: Nramp family divalent metal transporter, partial [Acidobacteria bacterium]|nr:Nramp family divalent metal transporter [Acidobacteriota bacterium]
VGYVALWVILLSCFIKPAIQAAIGRYTVSTGNTGLAGFNEVPGPRAGVNWIVWLWPCLIFMTRFQIGAMFGGVGQVLNQLIPSVSVNVWVLILLAFTLALLLGGGYERIERIATLKVALFTMLTFLCALLLMRKPQYFSWNQLASGLSFQMPPGGLASAVAVFGITGVGATELIYYPYWCVEKGYARYAGRRVPGAGWRDRALGWIRVMHVDILASMTIYTVATLAFYLLGAGILHGQGLVPAANDMIQVLSRMYTETLGGWALWLFYVGAVATLYGTIFAATASESRVFADMFRLLGFYQAGDYAARLRYRKLWVCILPTVSVGLYLLVQSPVAMVKAGGVAQALMLPIIAVAALYLRHRRLPPETEPTRGVTVWLWFAAIVVCALMVYYAYLTLR